MYRDGGLTVSGNGYGKLEGTIYLTGKFSVNDKNTQLDLNGKTIFSNYASCSDDAIYFKSDSTLYGPGCVIGVGNVNFQPKMAMGDQLLGVPETEDQDTLTTVPANRLILSKFTGQHCGKLRSFNVKCYIPDPEAPPAHIKLALYRFSDGALLNEVVSENVTFESSWNPVNFAETEVCSGVSYWMAAISDSPIIVWQPKTSTNKYKTLDYSTFSFPDNLSSISGLESQTTDQYMMRGYEGSQEFIFVMSVNCVTNFQPGASFFGSIAGKTSVTIKPNATINLVGLPEDGLDFPGLGPGSYSTGSGGNSPPLIKYNIQ